jgi:cyclic beta-1,2-glucan synthetase
VRLEHVLTAAAEWLLDNGYLIRTQIAEIRRHLPRKYHQILPAGDSGDPYIYELARELAANANYSLNEANIQECLRRYQEVAPLTIAELWSFPLLLRVALIEALARLAARISRAQDLREAAYFWANRLAAGIAPEPAGVRRDTPKDGGRADRAGPVFSDLPGRTTSGRRGSARSAATLDRGTTRQPLTEIVRTQHTQEAASSRFPPQTLSEACARLSRIEFADLFESVSLVEAELRTDPWRHLPAHQFCHARPLPARRRANLTA